MLSCKCSSQIKIKKQLNCCLDILLSLQLTNTFEVTVALYMDHSVEYIVLQNGKLA